MPCVKFHNDNHISLQNKCLTLKGKIWVGPASFPSLSYINFGKNCASVRQVSDLILKTATLQHGWEQNEIWLMIEKSSVKWATELFWRYVRHVFVSYSITMGKAVEIHKNKEMLNLQSQCYACWCSGDTRSQGISRQVEQVLTVIYFRML